MSRKATMLNALIALLTGCGAKPEVQTKAPPPEKPGVSVTLQYPVLLAGERTLQVVDDMDSLITTRVATGLNFPEFQFIDSSGQSYSVVKVTEFGRKPALMDMGTSPFQVYLQLKSQGEVSLEKAKGIALKSALAPNGPVEGTSTGAKVATERIRGAKSITELIEECRKSWSWR